MLALWAVPLAFGLLACQASSPDPQPEGDVSSDAADSGAVADREAPFDASTHRDAPEDAARPDASQDDAPKCGACDTPPASTCEGGALRVFEPRGSCDERNTCRYPNKVVACEAGCENGACKEDPCKGKTCSSPEAPSCKDATTLVTFDAAGTCSGGVCSYAKRERRCEFGCEGGSCKDDPCAGRTCNTPDAPSCKDARTLVTYEAAGTCSEGVCRYTKREIRCQFGCEAGACKDDPCAGKTCSTPDAPSCKDARTLVTFDAEGTCSGGLCSYAKREIRCEFGCEAGACNEDPCTRITWCGSPLPSTCISATTLRTYEGGRCEAGECKYPWRDRECEYACLNGRCVDHFDGCSTSCPGNARCVQRKCMPPACTLDNRTSCAPEVTYACVNTPDAPGDKVRVMTWLPRCDPGSTSCQGTSRVREVACRGRCDPSMPPYYCTQRLTPEERTTTCSRRCWELGLYCPANPVHIAQYEAIGHGINCNDTVPLTRGNSGPLRYIDCACVALNPWHQ
jgi:hypothetical protein